nr:acyltransferase [uncultured Agathobacter sp.]
MKKINTEGRKNNIAIVRFIAAIMVLYAHSYPISTGKNGDLIFRISKGGCGAGAIAVITLFFLSGFLNAKSIENNNCNMKKFLNSRILRILPELLFVCIISTLVIGPLVTIIPLKFYYENINVYLYPINSVLFGKHGLPGVFNNNVYANVVNGSLWTIKFEILCYFAVLVLYKLVKYNKKFKIFLYLSIMLSYGICCYFSIDEITNIIVPVLGFEFGILAYWWRKYIVLNKWIALSFVVLFMCSCYFCWEWIYAFWTLLYPIIYISFSVNKPIYRLFDKYEISYGIYLWAFPVQQIICMIFGGKMKPILNILLSLPIVIIIAFLSKMVIQQSAEKILKL